MKRTILAVCGAVLAGTMFCGCTTVESTQKFNALGLGTPNEKAVCQTFVEIPGYYFWGLPLLVGSAAGDGKCALFQYTGTTENVVNLLTREAKSKGAARVINVQCTVTETPVCFFLLTRRSMQASGTGVRSKDAAVKNAVHQYEMAP